MKKYSYIIRSSNGLAQTSPTEDLVRLKKTVAKYLTLLSQQKLISKEEREALTMQSQYFIGDVQIREMELGESQVPHYRSREYLRAWRREKREKKKEMGNE